MKRCLRLSSILLAIVLWQGCASPYKDLTYTSAAPQALRYKPVFDKALYRCLINGGFIFKKYHLSGLLFFNTLENGTVRAIYQNEMGLTFFDFEWDTADSFKINKLLPQLNKGPVVKILRKDLELMLMIGLNTEKDFLYADRGKEQISCFDIESGLGCYIEKDKQLTRIENAGKRKKVITINIEGKTSDKEMPGKAFFKHHKANFTIQLDKIVADVNE